jgi:hypothetical protein
MRHIRIVVCVCVCLCLFGIVSDYTVRYEGVGVAHSHRFMINEHTH